MSGVELISSYSIAGGSPIDPLDSKYEDLSRHTEADCLCLGN